MFRIQQFVALTGLTALEAVRRPLCLLLTTTSVVLTGAMPLLLMHNFGESGKLARDSGLALHFMFGLFVAGYAACSTLAREMRSGTASAVLSKPVGRSTLFLAKFAGVAVVVLAFSICSALATLLGERVCEAFYQSGGASGYRTDVVTGVLLLLAPGAAYALAALCNYRYRVSFESSACILLLICLAAVFAAAGFYDRFGRWDPIAFHVDWRIVPASLLVTLALLVLAAVALCLSTRLATAPTLSLCAALFVLGLVSDYLFGRWAATGAAARLLHTLLPNWQHFWLADALNGGGVIPGAYLLAAAGYAALYAAAALCFGLILFRHAEIA